MIESFVIVSKNGFKRPPGVFPPDIPKMDFFKPEYQRTHYSWEANGLTHTRAVDATETCEIELTPNKKYLVVTQASSKYGSDNLLVLNSDGTENRRLINPYRSSPEYQDGDQYEFLDVRIMGDKVLAKIAATRYVPSRSRNAEPVYGTFYDCDTWESTPLEFIDSRNL